jgi:hypothetical protein
MTEAGAAAAPVVFLQTAALGITIAQQQVPPHPAVVSASTGEQSSEAGGVTGPQSSSNAAGSCQQGQWVACWDYCNGGPVFLPPASQPADTARRDIQVSSSSSMQTSTELPAGVMPLAYYTALPHRPHLIARDETLRLPDEAAIAAAAVMPAPDPDESTDTPGQQPSVAALAAVRCEVGAGTAVLCSTHPELHPEWLDPAGSRHEVWQQQQQTQAGGKNSTDQPTSAAAGASDGQLDGGGEDTEEGLVWDTAALHQRLQACQASREVLLATLVWEALRHRLGTQ